MTAKITSLRDLHAQELGGGPGAGLQLPRRPARGGRGLRRAARPAKGGPLIPTLYDDGGLLGRNDGAPRAARLLADIEAGQVDVVVVYKIDRLTRSLVGLLAHRRDASTKAGASFVSVTQSFNTTTSHGPADAQRAAVVRPVRARGHRRAHPRQDRCLQGQGHVDGRRPATRLRPPAPGPGRSRSTRPKLRPSGTSSIVISSSALSTRCSANLPITASLPSRG